MNKFKTINPSQSRIPQSAIIKKVIFDDDRLPETEHEMAVQGFFMSDSAASGIQKDFDFVQKIPQLIKDIIDHKYWECFYVSRSVVVPYYCCYTRGTDVENFQEFIKAKRPNGLGTLVETLDNLLAIDPKIQKFYRDFLVYDFPVNFNLICEPIDDSISISDQWKLADQIELQLEIQKGCLLRSIRDQEKQAEKPEGKIFLKFLKDQGITKNKAYQLIQLADIVDKWQINNIINNFSKKALFKMIELYQSEQESIIILAKEGAYINLKMVQSAIARRIV